jgi:hypothetical protein
VAAAELAKGVAGGDPVRALLAGRPSLQHLLYSLEANSVLNPLVRGLLVLGLRGWG